MSFCNLITIDIGNSKTSCCLFTKESFYLFSINKIHSFIKEFSLKENNTQIYISNVTKKTIKLPFEATSMNSFFKNSSFLDMKVQYNETLGIDRLICAYYAFKKFESCTLIDTGTFTTVDLINNEFKGGFILPGQKLIEKSYQQGDQLKSFKIDFNYFSLPQTSHQAVNSGAYLSYLSPIEKVIKIYKSKDILITGGGGERLEKSLKSGASIHYIPDLIHRSMNLIHKEIS